MLHRSTPAGFTVLVCEIQKRPQLFFSKAGPLSSDSLFKNSNFKIVDPWELTRRANFLARSLTIWNVYLSTRTREEQEGGRKQF
jgi:hypothetical protein